MARLRNLHCCALVMTRLSVRKIAGVTVALLLVAGCQGRVPSPSVLDDPVCAPPCWQNITPGTTSRQEFLETVKGYRYLVSGSLHDYEASWLGFSDVVRGRLQLGAKTVTLLDAFTLDDKIADLSFAGDGSDPR